MGARRWQGAFLHTKLDAASCDSLAGAVHGVGGLEDEAASRQRAWEPHACAENVDRRQQERSARRACDMGVEPGIDSPAHHAVVERATPAGSIRVLSGAATPTADGSSRCEPRARGQCGGEDTCPSSPTSYQAAWWPCVPMRAPAEHVATLCGADVQCIPTGSHWTPVGTPKTVHVHVSRQVPLSCSPGPGPHRCDSPC